MLEKMAIRLFGDITRPYLGYFEPLRNTLKTADMKMPVHEYISTLLLASIISRVEMFTIKTGLGLLLNRILY